MLTVLAYHILLVAVLAVVVEMACRWGKFRPAICHALWLVVLIKLLIPPVMAWPSPVQEMLPNASQTFIEFEQAQTSVKTPTQVATPDLPTPQPIVQSPTPFSIWQYLTPLLAAIWLTGCIFALALHGTRIRRFRSLIKQAQTAPDWLQDSANTLAMMFGVRSPAVKIVSGIPAALVWNPLRSKILVSSDLLNTIIRDEWNGILSHELAHLKRRDLWVGWLELTAACLCWWNPVLFLVRRRLHLYAELACDAWVLWAQPDTGNQYAEVLYRIVSSENQQKTPVPAFGMATGPAAAFKIRLAMLLQGGAACRMSKKATIAVITLLFLALPSLTTTAKAGQRIPAPITYAPPSEPENTRDANAILETRLYLVKGKIDVSGGVESLPSVNADSPNQSLAFRMIYSGIDPSKLHIKGMPIIMEGETLLWNGKEEPDSPKVAHVASPVFALRPNDAVSVATAVPAQALDWFNADKPLQFKFTCSPETDVMRFCISIALSESNEQERKDASTQVSQIYANLTVQSPLNKWQAFAMDVYPRKNDHSPCIQATLLVFCKRKAWDPAQAVQNLPGPTHGEFDIKHNYYQTPDPKVQLTSEMKLIEGNAAEIENLVTGLSPLTDATTSPADLRIFRLPRKDDVGVLIEKLNQQAPTAQLILAPRVTFNIDNKNPPLFDSSLKTKIVIVHPHLTESRKELPVKDIFKIIESFSGSLADYFSHNKPKAVIMSVDTDKRSTKDVVTGIALAFATENEIHDNALGINFYYNFREAIPHHHANLFGKREPMPDVKETVVTVKMPYRLDEGLCFITQALDPKKLRISFLTLEPVGKDTQFYNSEENLKPANKL